MERSDRIDLLKKYKVIVFGFEHYNPLDQIRTFGSIGIKPIGVFIKSKYRFASFSRWLSEVYIVESIDEGYKLILSKFKDPINKAFLVTSDDIITSYLDEHYDSLEPYFFFNNCGKTGGITKLMEKPYQKKIANDAGFNTPKLYSFEEIKDNDFPIICKTKNSLVENWKSFSRVCKTRADLDDVVLTKKDLIFEEYIDRSNEIAVEGYSYGDGESVFAKLCLKRNYLVEGAPGKKLYCEALVDNGIISCVKKYLKSIKFNGVFELEMLVDKQDKVYFSEINLRNSGLGIATTVAGASNLLGWCYACLEETNHVPEEPTNVPIVGMDDFADFKIRVLKEKRLSFFKWFKEFKQSDFTFYYDKRDKKPFRKALSHKFLKRHKKSKSDAK